MKPTLGIPLIESKLYKPATSFYIKKVIEMEARVCTVLKLFLVAVNHCHVDVY